MRIHQASFDYPVRKLSATFTFLVTAIPFAMAGLGVMAVLGAWSAPQLVLGLFAVANFGLAALAVVQAHHSGSRPVSYAVPLVAAVAFVPVVLLPSLSQAGMKTESKLIGAGIPVPVALGENMTAIIALSLSTVVLGLFAVIGSRLVAPTARSLLTTFGGASKRVRGPGMKSTHSVMMLVAPVAAGLAVLLAPSGERGSVQGAGFSVMLGWCLPMTVAVGVAYGHFNSKFRLLYSLLGILYILIGDVRSPLLLVLVAFIVSSLTFRRSRAVKFNARVRRLILVLVVGVGASIVGAAISKIRGSEMRRENLPVSDQVLDVILNPFEYVAASGLDSYDGFRLSMAVSRADFEVSSLDPLKGFLNLIPRFLYAGKEPWLGNIITRNVLGWDKGGIFLSGVGYLTLIGGGLLVAFVLLSILGIFLGFAEAWSGTPFVRVLLAYFSFRFLMGGDAFDLQHVLMLTLIIVGFYVATSALWSCDVLKREDVGSTELSEFNARKEVSTQ